ncbi:TWiK family of potassium channels protein 18 isoform X2 [Halyomorpha halys]|uniref:TWiK family of potassium channels protein 18 isoform X2 n=1 Tax=Halyomorpha halys TaxID=286706 RepID=UPI0006D517C9
MDEETQELGSPKRPPRPQINLQIPTTTPNGGNLTSPGIRPYYSGPLTPQGEPIYQSVNILQAYPNKAGEYFAKQFTNFRDFTLNTAKSGMSVGEKASIWFYTKIWALSRKWFTHLFLFTVVALYSLLGGFMFSYIEGTAEEENVIDILKKRRHLLLEIRQHFREMEIPENKDDEDEWLGKSTASLRAYEGVLLEHFKQDTHIMSKGDKPQWDFWSSVFYCGTIFTTIGYGHIAPVTTTGRAVTIVYAIIGIPLFLILLADFGKMLTRGIKFVWAFVRRVYYTGSCRKVRKAAPMQEMMKGVQIINDLAHLRRPSQTDTAHHHSAPPTPAPSAFAVDDEFNLPITVAIVILLLYIFLGAGVFWIWESDWTFFESFYFIFISMSTIGFGDLVPQNQMYMMASIVYLVFGLALTSMCINVVQEKLSVTFRQASAKIGATIGLKVEDEDGTGSPVSPTHVQVAEVHKKPEPNPKSKKK